MFPLNRHTIGFRPQTQKIDSSIHSGGVRVEESALTEIRF